MIRAAEANFLSIFAGVRSIADPLEDIGRSFKCM
jgi:hypothetical protein